MYNCYYLNGTDMWTQLETGETCITLSKEKYRGLNKNDAVATAANHLDAIGEEVVSLAYLGYGVGEVYTFVILTKHKSA